MMAAILLLCALLVAVSRAEIIRYDGHKVIRVQASNQEQLQWLAKLHDESTLDFWTHPSLIRPTDIRLSPSEYKNLINQFSVQGFNITVVHGDVQQLIESVGQHPHSPDKRQLQLSASTVIGGFPRYDRIYEWAKKKQSTNQKIMSISSIGKTYEGRDQYLIKLGVQGVNKPAIWIDSGIHAREWLSVSTTLNIIEMMLNGYEVKDPVMTDLLTTFDWYILPVANPDGYEFSHSSGGRLWRKTRTRYTYGIGADPNRNWDFYWGTTGVSRSSSSDQYCGPSKWSEKCVYNMATKLVTLKSTLKVYMTLHSYGQMWFVPYGYSRTVYPSNYRDMYQMGATAVEAMRKSTGAVFRLGRVPDLLYEASGSSMDWVRGRLGTEYTFGMELRPTHKIHQGFITSTASIRPAAQEVWAGIKSVAQQVKSKLVRG